MTLWPRAKKCLWIPSFFINQITNPLLKPFGADITGLLPHITAVCSPQHSVEVTSLVPVVSSSPQTGPSGMARGRTAAGGYTWTRTSGCCSTYNCEHDTNTQTHKHQKCSKVLLLAEFIKTLYWAWRPSVGAGTPSAWAYFPLVLNH